MAYEMSQCGQTAAKGEDCLPDQVKPVYKLRGTPTLMEEKRMKKRIERERAALKRRRTRLFDNELSIL